MTDGEFKCPQCGKVSKVKWHSDVDIFGRIHTSARADHFDCCIRKNIALTTKEIDSIF